VSFIKIWITHLILLTVFVSTNVYAGTLQPILNAMQTLSAYGQTGVATWSLGETGIISGEGPQIITHISFSGLIGDIYMPAGVNYIISCDLSLTLEDNSVRSFSFILNNSHTEEYSFPETIHVSKFLGGHCSGQFTNTNDYNVTFQSDRNNGYANVMSMALSGPGYTQGFLYLLLKGTLDTTPGCTVDIDNPSISVSGTQYEYKQGFSIERMLNVECTNGVPQPNIALTSAGRVISNCVLMTDGGGGLTDGPQVCVYEGDKLLPLDFSTKHNITIDKSTNTAQSKLTFKISSSPDDDIKMQPGDYTAVVYIVVSPI
jgi:hypothetical protein